MLSDLDQSTDHEEEGQAKYHVEGGDGDVDQLGLVLRQPNVLIVLVLWHEVSEADSGERHEAEVDGVEEVPLLGVDEHESS